MRLYTWLSMSCGVSRTITMIFLPQIVVYCIYMNQRVQGFVQIVVSISNRESLLSALDLYFCYDVFTQP